MVVTIEQIDRAAKAHRKRLAHVAESRAALHNLIRAGLASGITQADIVRVTGFTRETIRKISKGDSGAD